MTNADLEKELRQFDYSSLSKVKKSLLAELLQAYEKKFPDEMMSEEELDCVAAAGNLNHDKKKSSE